MGEGERVFEKPPIRVGDWITVGHGDPIQVTDVIVIVRADGEWYSENQIIEYVDMEDEIANTD